MVTAKPELPPVEVTVKDPTGKPIIGAHVRATYAYSGLSSSGISAADGVATISLLYCDNEPMCIEAVATSYQAENVAEYQPNREAYKLPMTLQDLKSEWEQVTIPLSLSNDSGSSDLPMAGRINVQKSSFHLSNQGDVSVNGSVQPWHQFQLAKEYNVVMRDGTAMTIRFLERTPGFSVTLEISPPWEHRCGV